MVNEFKQALEKKKVIKIITSKEKKAILDKIYYEIGKQSFDFYVAGNYTKKGEIMFSKWKKYSDAVMPIDFDGKCNNGKGDDWKKQKYFEQINQRQIFPNEIVLDLEETEQLEPIKKELNLMFKNKECDNFKIYFTGSRGYHIHLFFKEDFTEEEKLFILKKFGVDEQKASNKNLIALEGFPHWKTGKIKELVYEQK